MIQALELADISRAVKARHVSTAISEAHTVAPDEVATTAAATLLERQFDFAPVVDGGRVLGIFVAREASDEGTVNDDMRPVAPELLVAADTPFTALVDLLCERELILVLHEHEITGLVTRSDLGSAPARTHYYLRLASAEMHLAAYIRGRYPEQSAAVDHLNRSSRERHQRTVDELRRTDTYLDDVAALSFADLVFIAGKDESFREHACRVADRGWRWLSDGIANFRNDIMHPARDITSLPGFTVTKLADAERRITALRNAARTLLQLRDAVDSPTR